VNSKRECSSAARDASNSGKLPPSEKQDRNLYYELDLNLNLVAGIMQTWYRDLEKHSCTDEEWKSFTTRTLPQKFDEWKVLLQKLGEDKLGYCNMYKKLNISSNITAEGTPEERLDDKRKATLALWIRYFVRNQKLDQDQNLQKMYHHSLKWSFRLDKQSALGPMGRESDVENNTFGSMSAQDAFSESIRFFKPSNDNADDTEEAPSDTGSINTMQSSGPSLESIATTNL
jgi:hypothetical protein